MSRDFAPVAPAIWSSPAFLSLDGDSRQLLLYFITGPHQNSSGCARVREGYALADLKWEAAQYRAALSDIVAADLVMYDPATEEVYVKKWFRHKGNNPTNRDHAKGCMKIIANIDSDEMREFVEAEFMQTEWAAKTFAPAPELEPSRSLDVTSKLANSRIVRGSYGGIS